MWLKWGGKFLLNNSYVKVGYLSCVNKAWPDWNMLECERLTVLRPNPKHQGLKPARHLWASQLHFMFSCWLPHCLSCSHVHLKFTENSWHYQNCNQRNERSERSEINPEHTYSQFPVHVVYSGSWEALGDPTFTRREAGKVDTSSEQPSIVFI